MDSDALNTCLKGVRMAGVQPGDTVLVIGQGPIGMLFTQLARLAGASVVATDMIASRRETALRIDVTHFGYRKPRPPRRKIGVEADRRVVDQSVVA